MDRKGQHYIEIFLTDVVTSLTSSVITFGQQVACNNDGKTEFLKVGHIEAKVGEKFTAFFSNLI